KAATQLAEYNKAELLFRQCLIAVPPGVNMLEVTTRMETSRVQYNDITARMAKITNEANALVRKRTEAIEKSKHNADEISRDNQKLDRRSGRLKNQRQKLQANSAVKSAKGTKGSKRAAAPVVETRQFRFKDLLPLNLERERDRLLESVADAGQERVAE